MDDFSTWTDADLESEYFRLADERHVLHVRHKAVVQERRERERVTLAQEMVSRLSDSERAALHQVLSVTEPIDPEEAIGIPGSA